MTLLLQNRYKVLSSLQGEGKLGQQIHSSNSAGMSVVSFQLTKKYFKVLQATHHSVILTKTFQQGQLPPGMTRQVQKLTKFIKPACPTTSTTSALLIGSEGFSLEAFDKAVQWAKSRYGKKLTTSSIEAAKRLLEEEVRPPTINTTPLTFSLISNHPWTNAFC